MKALFNNLTFNEKTMLRMILGKGYESLDDNYKDNLSTKTKVRGMG